MEIYQPGLMMKHVGAYAGRRVILLMPDQADFNYVLLIEIERLPHSLEEIILREVSSALAQQQVWFALALHGVQYDGVNMIHFLMKTAGAITRAEASQVLMIPKPSVQSRLTDFYEQMVLAEPQLANAYRAWKANSASNTLTQAPKEPEVLSNAQHNEAVEASDNNKAIARNLLLQAKMLQADADAKFAEALKFDPSLQSEVTPAASNWVDSETGKSYKTEAAMKAAVSRRENAKI